MRNIFILIILSISVLKLYSQNYEPGALPFDWGNYTDQPFNPSEGQFKQTKFLTGFQWSGSQKFNKLMKNNANAGSTGFAERLYGRHDLYTESIKGIKQPDGLPIRICRAMVYEPTLIVTNPDILNTRPNDTTNAIWGFKAKRMGEILSNDPNRLTLRYTDYSSAGYPVLDSISEQPNFETFKGGSQKVGYFGHRWFLSVNLRRISNSTLADSLPFLSIKLKYKFVDSINGRLSDWQYMKFDSIPQSASDSCYDLPNIYGTNISRGVEQKKVECTAATYSLDINKSMLNSINTDKTISASFLTIYPIKNSKYFNNPGYPTMDHLINPEFLKDVRIRTEVGHIAEMDIEVRYYGGVDVAIDYIKIENENGYYLSRGYADDIPDPSKYLKIVGDYNYGKDKNIDDVYQPKAAMYGIKQSIQKSLNLLDSTVRRQPNGLQMEEMFRVFIEDTESDNPNTWFQLRYANLVTNGVAVPRDNPYKSDAYYYYTKAPNRYLGMKICELQRFLPAPWVFTTNSALERDYPAVDKEKVTPQNPDLRYKRMNLKWGAMNTCCVPPSPVAVNPKLNSAFETDLIRGSAIPTTITDIYSNLSTVIQARINNTDELKYLDNMEAATDYLQIRYEWYNRRIFYKSQAFLYSEKPWFMNFFLTNEFSDDWGETPVSYFSGHRPHTGEETRLLISGVLLKGAKGLFYDRESRYYSNMYKFPEQGGEFQLGMASPLEPILKDSVWTYDYNFLMKKELGDDYIFQDSYPKAISRHYADPNVRLQIENALGVEHNKLYLGMRSTRLEIYKIHSWIRRLEEIGSEDNLMNLRLVAWKGKGFKEWYNQDPATSVDKVMNKYIGMDGIRTAKLYQPNEARFEDGILIPANNFKNVSDDNRTVIDWEGDPSNNNTDSSFYDITILRREKQPIGAIGDFYIGIQNRRTDPLIYEIEKDYGDLKFYSTAEFEDLCHSSDENTRRKYRDYYWKRLGCRLISIPLTSVFNPRQSFCDVGFIIKELLADDDEFNKENARWRDKDFTHLTNYYQIGQFSNNAIPTLKIRMLPGEGKLVKLKKVYYPYVAECPDSKLTPLQVRLEKSFDDSLGYSLVLENNTDIPLKQMVVIFEGEDTEAISITPNKGVEISNYYEEDVDKPNCKAILLNELKAYSKIDIGQLVCSKKNSGKFLYQLEVINAKNERCSNKLTASVSNLNKKSADELESIDNKVSNISIAPNPAKDRAELSFTATEQGNAEIIVVDILGNQLLRISDYIAYPGANSLNINLSNFSGGVYNVIVKTISGVSTQKFSVVK